MLTTIDVTQEEHQPQLPAELLRSIFVFAARNARSDPLGGQQRSPKRQRRSHTGTGNVTPLLSVSKAVQHWVFAELLHSLIATSPAQIVALGKLFAKNPHLGQHVRRFWVGQISDDGQCGRSEAATALERYILPCLSRLDNFALSDLNIHIPRSHGRTLWGISRARHLSEWGQLRSLTLLGVRGMSTLLDPADNNRQAMHSTDEAIFHGLETLRIGLSEELTAKRIQAISKCSGLRLLELAEPGLETNINIDPMTGAVIAAGIGMQTLACIRGPMVDEATIRALFHVLTRSEGSSGLEAESRGRLQAHEPVAIRIYTQSPEAYSTLRERWQELRQASTIRHKAQLVLQGNDSDALENLWETKVVAPTLTLHELIPRTEPRAEESDEDACAGQDLGRGIPSEPAEGRDATLIAAEDAAEWKLRFQEVLRAHWARH
ncbi:hypothetical protein V8E36_007454 [Tilletia maclaganii]